MTDWPNPNLFPEFYDPFADASRHPILPCGYNSAAMNGDEANGAGLNEPIWPMLFDSYIGFAPIILTTEKLEVFNECPDIVFACPDNVEVLPNLQRLTELRRGWREQQIPAQPNTLVVEPWDDTQVISKGSNLVALPKEIEGVTLTAQKEMEVTE